MQLVTRDVFSLCRSVMNPFMTSPDEREGLCLTDKEEKTNNDCKIILIRMTIIIIIHNVCVCVTVVVIGLSTVIGICALALVFILVAMAIVVVTVYHQRSKILKYRKLASTEET